MTKIEVIAKVQEILRDQCDDPAEEMIRTGNLLVSIGRALSGLELRDARAVIAAVANIEIGI